MQFRTHSVLGGPRRFGAGDSPFIFRDMTADGELVYSQLLGGADEARVSRGGLEHPQGLRPGQGPAGDFSIVQHLIA